MQVKRKETNGWRGCWIPRGDGTLITLVADGALSDAFAAIDGDGLLLFLLVAAVWKYRAKKRIGIILLGRRSCCDTSACIGGFHGWWISW